MKKKQKTKLEQQQTLDTSLSDKSCSACTGKGMGKSSDNKINPVVKFSGFAEANTRSSLKRMYHVLVFTAEENNK